MELGISTFSLFVCFVYTADSCIPYFAKRISSFDGKKISKSLIWTRGNLTKGQCVAECYKEMNCTSIHYSTQESTCISLAEKFEDVNVTTEDAPGYQLFQTTKSSPFMVCAVNEDCADLINGHCNNGRCGCDIGYGFYLAFCRNLTECITFSNMFTTYEGRLVNGHDIDEAGNQSLASCQEMCIDNPQCKSADIYVPTNRCWTSDVNWLAVSRNDHGNDTGYMHIQRECNWYGDN